MISMHFTLETFFVVEFDRKLNFIYNYIIFNNFNILFDQPTFLSRQQSNNKIENLIVLIFLRPLTQN